MLNNKLKTLIIGLGQIGLKYDLRNKKILTHSKAVFKHKFFDLIGGIEKKKNLRKIFKKRYKKNCFDIDNDKLLNYSVDLAVISVNTINHLKILKKVIRLKNLRFIIIEKPVGRSFVETREIISECNKRSIKIIPNYIRLFDKETQNIKKIINRKLNKNFNVNVLYNHDLRNNCSHMISLVLFWLGDFKSIKKIKKINKNCYNFTLSFTKCDANFTCKNNINAKSDIRLFKNDYEIYYKSDGEIIEYNDKKKNNLKKITNYEYINRYQYNVYDALFKNKKNKFFFNKFMNNALETQKIIKKITSH